MGYFPQAAFLRRSEAEVALLRLLQLQGRAFDPAVVNVMVTAFDDTLRELKLSSRHDPLVERVAQTICAEKGMRDAAEMRDCALKAIRNVCRPLNFSLPRAVGLSLARTDLNQYSFWFRILDLARKQPGPFRRGARRDERRNEIGLCRYSGFNSCHLRGGKAEEHREPRGKHGGRSRTEAA